MKLGFEAKCRHIWWGVSVEDKQYGLTRVGHLQASPAAVKFLSIEPLLENLGRIGLYGIDWVIVGGESGPGARPMKKEWVLSIREECKQNRVRFFFKQWGGVRKKMNGRTLNGRTYDEYPERSRNVIAPKQERLALALQFTNSFIPVGALA